MPKKDFIDTCDFSKAEMQYLIELGLKIKEAIAHGYYPQLLKNKSLGMIFDQTSTRTRVSAEAAMTELGGHALYLAPGQIQLGKGGHEGLADTSRVLGDLLDLLGARISSHEELTNLAKYSKAPVVSFMSDQDHPTQALGDLITIEEHLPVGKKLAEVKIVFVGDATQVAVSTMLFCAQMGMQFIQYGPQSKHMPKDLLARAKKLAAESGGLIEVSADDQVLKGADFIYTDVWYGLYDQEMGKEEYLKLFYPKYQVNEDLLQKTANPEVKFMHCLPANRGEEVTAAVLEGDSSIAWEQSENKKAAMRAIFVYLLNPQLKCPTKNEVKQLQADLDDLLAREI
ncbi:ornithine carbamoyltransferase [Lactobacillus xylocopicola]|uniref:Ornithine carbamoyltransferase n=1 Tax=Lactobacillus xylocopicola TaxID=2976676 RepID=A0ABN6SIU9_9LACO|nr:ornithine carbamoyltransferase [Lactobacillus xylocopicola]BDR60265.1 putrescine carbamoyltransferase [Lactobacillus xylocopicola]